MRARVACCAIVPRPASVPRRHETAVTGALMSYLLLIVEPRGQREERGLEGGRADYASMGRYAESLKQRGVLLAVESLRHDRQGARLAVRSGKRTVVDGPFTRSEEH